MPQSFYSEKFSEIINHIPYPLREKNKSTTILQGDFEVGSHRVYSEV